MRRKLWIGLSLAILFLAAEGAAGQQSRQQSQGSPPAAPQITNNGDQDESPALQRRSRYRLRLSDVLALSFPFSPEFDQVVTIQPDGYITVRGVGSVRLEGYTIPQSVEVLQDVYSKILREPVITVELREFERPYFIVGGEVGEPGKFDLRGDTTIAEGVAIAGGLRDSAKHSQVYLFRRVQDGWLQARKVNLKKLLAGGNMEEAPYLQPGDFVYVPKSTFAKISRFIPSTSLGAYVPILQR
jgi:Periplasmic protein involved in polysaccharide export